MYLSCEQRSVYKTAAVFKVRGGLCLLIYGIRNLLSFGPGLGGAVVRGAGIDYVVGSGIVFRF